MPWAEEQQGWSKGQKMIFQVTAGRTGLPLCCPAWPGGNGGSIQDGCAGGKWWLSWAVQVAQKDIQWERGWSDGIGRDVEACEPTLDQSGPFGILAASSQEPILAR